MLDWMKGNSSPLHRADLNVACVGVRMMRMMVMVMMLVVVVVVVVGDAEQ